MAARLVRARIGYARIPSSSNPSQASYTRDIRDQMKAIEDNLTAVIESVKEAGPDIVIEALQPTFDKSQTYCPVDKGDLKASGYLSADKQGDNVVANIGYGRGGQPPYAVFVHERTDLQHASPTRAKFLQSAIEEDLDSIKNRLIEGYRGLLV